MFLNGVSVSDHITTKHDNTRTGTITATQFGMYSHYPFPVVECPFDTYDMCAWVGNDQGLGNMLYETHA